MDIREIDCVSFATRVGFTAGMELKQLLAGDGEDNEAPPDQEGLRWDSEPMIVEMGRYICARDCKNGEQLFNHMREHPDFDSAPHWADYTPQSQLCWMTFMDVCRRTFQHLITLQGQAEIEAARENAPPAPGLKREDSIFEEHGSLGELDPARVGALEQIAKHDQKMAEEAAHMTATEADKGLEAARANMGKALGPIFSAFGLGGQAAQQQMPAQERKPAQQEPITVGEPPAGAAKPKRPRKTRSKTKTRQ